MCTLPARPARDNRKPPAPPRPPRSFAFDGITRELTLVDCCGVREVYRVLPLRSDFGTAWELINVGERFGAAWQVLHDESGAWLCSCPGGCWRPEFLCKHRAALKALREGGAL